MTVSLCQLTHRPQSHIIPLSIIPYRTIFLGRKSQETFQQTGNHGSVSRILVKVAATAQAFRLLALL